MLENEYSLKTIRQLLNCFVYDFLRELEIEIYISVKIIILESSIIVI